MVGPASWARRETEAMARMNRNRAGGGDDDFASFGEEPTFPARYPGTCATCRQRFAVEDPIASVIVDKKTTYHHGACRYPATALLSQEAMEADVGTGFDDPRPGKCRATTSKGKSCNNAPQKGEQFCGPHLTQHRGGFG
jgi:hypothetical protein